MFICMLAPLVQIIDESDKMNETEITFSIDGVQQQHDSDDKWETNNQSIKILSDMVKPIDNSLEMEKPNDCRSTILNRSFGASNEDNGSQTSADKPKRLQRKLSDSTGRKRSTSNICYKCCKSLQQSTTPISSSRMINNNNSNNKGDMIDAHEQSKSCASIENRYHLDTGMGFRRQLLYRQSPSPPLTMSCYHHRCILNSPNLCPGYMQYQMSLLAVPLPNDYGDASSDDLSSEWDSDVPEPQRSPKPSGWRKLRNIVQWTPFFQTYKKQRYPWVQLAGHQGNFKAGPDPGTVLKKLCPKEEKCFYVLMTDVLRPYVPEYKGQVTSDDGELYLQLQDLLSDFNQPCVMDCKIGVRTYLEEELSKAKEKPKLRKDMYEKMIQIDPNAPSDDENKAKGVTKPRYMVWRETISSTATLGFRIEGIKKGDGTSSKDFKTTKSKEQILAAFKDFTQGFPHAVTKYIHRLRAIRATLDCSNFFLTHEVIGSSLLFVHDHKQASIWLIDFAKTVILPTDMLIDHNTKWSVGNHEDGYLIGITNLIEIFEELQLQMNCNDDAMMLTKMPMPITMVNTINTYSGNSQCSGVSNSNSSSNNINSTNNNNDNKNNNSNDSSQHKHPHSGVPNNELTMDEMKNDTHMLANNVTEQFENTSLN